MPSNFIYLNPGVVSQFCRLCSSNSTWQFQCCTSLACLWIFRIKSLFCMSYISESVTYLFVSEISCLGDSDPIHCRANASFLFSHLPSTIVTRPDLPWASVASRYYLCVIDKSTMKALVANHIFRLEQREVKIPKIKDNEVLIKVWAVGVNKDDIIDLKTSVDGFCPGLECSGIIEAVGRNVNRWKVGERVCTILEQGGYAEQVAVPADFLLPLPDDIDLYDAAGLPYASCCIWLALLKMHPPETLEDKSIMIRECFNGIGPLAIQYAKYMGLKVITSTGNMDNSKIYDYYGADFCIDDKSVLEKAGNLGADFVLDCGSGNLPINICCCRTRGTIVTMQLDGSKYTSVDLTVLQRNHAELKVVSLLRRDFQYKASAIVGLKTRLWPAILEKKVVPAIFHCFPASEVEKAMDLLDKNRSIGKIILRMDFGKSSGHLKMQ